MNASFRAIQIIGTDLPDSKLHIAGPKLHQTASASIGSPSVIGTIKMMLYKLQTRFSHCRALENACEVLSKSNSRGHGVTRYDVLKCA